MTSDGFKYSDFKQVSKKKRKNRPAHDRPSLLSQIQSVIADWAENDWLSDCQTLLREHLETRSPKKVLCLGLGSLSSPNSRAQLAFLLEICKTAAIEHADVSVYDPVFTEEDKAVFGALGMIVATENQEGRYRLADPTILWMPHCDLDLYENVVATNWSREHLSRLILIGNRLGDYIESHPQKKLETRAPHILRLDKHLECRLLPESLAWKTAFNNTAIQYLPTSSEIRFLEADGLAECVDSNSGNSADNNIHCP